jgi:DNA-binding NarL/FixJ family response regulator
VEGVLLEAIARDMPGGAGAAQCPIELSTTPRTASVHVSSIVAELGVSTRTEAATVHRMHVTDGRGPQRP